ncbi:MAG TPA: peptidyl-prolyl cis-trans isomerase [Phycisphaerales bacterium]|nr:peptidyl-prolyl cis-trans isomerase [Phycisphaerales bacterium]
MKSCLFVLLVLLAIAGVSSGVNPQVTLHISGAVSGDIVLELYQEQAPGTVANFVDYVQSGFYDGLIFHRVIDDFMVQGGGFDPNLVKITPGDPIINESSNVLSNLQGTIAMARTTDPHTATSEFFINDANNLFLDHGSDVKYAEDESQNLNAYFLVGYCVFGRVIDGMDVVAAISAEPTQVEGGMRDVPIDDIIIQSATLDTPVCIEELEGDIDGDCDVDLADFVKLAENWLACNAIEPPCI